MAHFAKLDSNNIVVTVLHGRDQDNENELTSRTGDVYKQTSYNTRGNVHYNSETGLPSDDQTKAFRKNYAGIGYVYDSSRDAFYAPKPYNSWTLNEDSCIWDPPTPYPDDGNIYIWSEETTSWIQP